VNASPRPIGRFQVATLGRVRRKKKTALKSSQEFNSPRRQNTAATRARAGIVSTQALTT